MTDTTHDPDDLLQAAGSSAATIERRKTPTKRLWKDRRKSVQRCIGLEVSPEGISLAVREQRDPESTEQLIIRHVKFPAQSGPTQGDWSDDTLVNVLKELASEYHLSGQAVVVGLGGDPCLTRVVMGENDEVQNDTQEVTERSRRYIGMGRGEKVCCKMETQIDAKRKRTWVTVAMRDVVDAIVAAVDAAGMRLARIEHTMIILCRILGAHGTDQESPVLMIVDENGRIDLGISHKGQLLLDYRPAMSDEPEGRIIARHLKCVGRYLMAKLRQPVDVQDVYVTGDQDERQRLFQSLKEETPLRCCHFPTEKLVEKYAVDGEPSEDPGVMAAIWLATDGYLIADDVSSNDLLSTLRPSAKVSWLSLLATTWPVSAAAILTIALFGAGRREAQQADQFRTRAEALTADNMEVKRLRFLFEKEMRLRQQITSIDDHLGETRWAPILLKCGSLMPQGVWLETLRIDHRPSISITGASFTDDAIYEYINQLEKEALFVHVALESTNETQVASGPAFRFEITASVVEDQSPAESTNVASRVRRAHSG